MERPIHRYRRFKDWDYSRGASFFITLSLDERKPLFGQVHDGIVCLSELGREVLASLERIPVLEPAITLYGHVVMPDHVHFILEQPVCQAGDHIGAPLREIVSWFKTMTTNDYIRHVKRGEYAPFEGRLWQRNYYEHVIRNEEDYLQTAAYIEGNPTRWSEKYE